MRWLVVLLLLIPAVSAQAIYGTDELITGDVDNIDYAASGTAPETGKAYAAFGQAATTYTTAFDGTFDKDYLAGEWTLQLFLSCDQPTAYRPTSTTNAYRPTLAATLFVAGSEIGVGYGESELRTCDGPADVWALDLPMVSDVAPTAGSTFRLEVNVWWANPPPGDGQNGYFLIGGDQPTALVGLVEVITAPERQTVNTTLEGAFAPVFTNATDATYQIAFAAADGEKIEMEVGGSKGNVTIDVLGSNGTLFTQTGSDWAANLTLEAGSYQAVVNMTGFVGSIRLDMVTPEPVLPDEGTDPEAPADDNSTADPDAEPDDEDKDSPGLPLVAALLVLAWVAGRRRS